MSIGDCRMVLRSADFATQAQTIEVLIVPDGEVRSINGDFTIDDESWAAMDKAFRKHATMLPIDYEHQTLGGDYASPDGTSPAAGWVMALLRYEKGKGIIAKVAWTERARNMIRAGEYQYLSPVVVVRKSDRKAVGLHSLGLTNKPAIVAMERVAAKEMNELPAGQRKDVVMDELKLIGKGLDLAEADCTVEKITNKFGETKKRADAATAVANAATAVANAARKALGLKDDADESVVVLAVNTLKQAKDSVGAMQGELTTIKNKLADRDVDDLIAAHGRGKINPEDAVDLKVCREVARRDPEEFKKWMGARPVKLEGGRTTPPEGGAKTTAGKEEALIANSVKEHKGNYGDAISALQVELKKPYLEQGLTHKAANAACATQYPKIFAV